MTEKNSILITGCNGFIGSNVARFYREKGYNTIGVDLNPVSLVDGVKYYQLNLATDNLNSLLIEHRPYALIHCAGVADVSYSVKYPDNDFYQNVVVSRRLMYSLKDFSSETKFIFLSSAGVYGNPQSLPVREDSERKPISPYALHKKLVEEIIQYFRVQCGLDIKILRIFSAYGNGLKKQIFWDMAQKFKYTGKLELFGTGNETRDFIHIRDLIKAIFIITEGKNYHEPIYNVANGSEISIGEIAEIFCENVGCSKGVIKFNGQVRKGDPARWCADIEKIKKIGYVQEVDIIDGVKEYVKWLKVNNYI